MRGRGEGHFIAELIFNFYLCVKYNVWDLGDTNQGVTNINF